MSERIREGAIRWLLWLRSGAMPSADLDAFRCWRAQSDEHARIARDLIWLWNMLGLLVDLERPGCAARLEGQRSPATIENRIDRADLPNRRMPRSVRMQGRRRRGA